MEKKKQIIMIGGANKWVSADHMYKFLKEEASFNPYQQRKKWREWVAFGHWAEYESIDIPVPNRDDADYEAWKIVFERHFEFLNNEKLILIGHSMGAIFLLKYLSENKLPYVAEQIHLVAPVIQDDAIEGGEMLGNFKPDLDKLPEIAKQSKDVFLYHSRDDDICSFQDSEKIAEIIPEIKFEIFEDRGHFLQSAFPELFANIPSDIFKK